MASLLNGFGGTNGFGDPISIGRNDDQVTPRFDVSAVFGNGLNFFGNTYSSFFISNNGRLTFSTPDGTFTPSAITANTNNPQIDAFFADVDTRLPTGVTGPLDPTPGGTSAGTDLAYVALDPATHRVALTWDDVGYFGAHVDKLNAFQIVLTDRSTGNSPGDFDIQFRYEAVNWTTGDASSGHNGLGGTIARAGYSAGTGNPAQYFELPESGNQGGDGAAQPGMLDLATTPGNSGLAGIWDFAVRNGTVDAPPSVSAGPPSAVLVEAGVSGAGVAASTVALTKSDPDGTTPSYVTTGLTALGNGRYSANGQFGTAVLDTGNNTLTYALDNSRTATDALRAGQQASDAFTVTVTDGALSYTAPVTFQVSGRDDAPTAVADALSTTRNQAVAVPVATLLANDTDPESDPLTLTGVGQAVHGTVGLNNGVVTFTPEAGFTGTGAGFAYTESDGQGGTATGRVAVTVAAPGNNTPVVVGSGPDSFEADLSENGSLTGLQFTLSVDGHQIGGVQTVTASHDAGQTNHFVVRGNFGTNAHRFTVDVLKGSTPGDTPALSFIGSSRAVVAPNGDQALYVDRISQFGQSYKPEYRIGAGESYNISTVNLDPSHHQANGNPAFAPTVAVNVPGLHQALLLENMPGQFLHTNRFTVGELKTGINDFLAHHPNFLAQNNNPAVAQDYRAALSYLDHLSNSAQITVDPISHNAAINGQVIGTAEVLR